MRGVLGGKILFWASLVLSVTVLLLATGCTREELIAAQQQAEADQAAAAAAATATPTPSGVPNASGTTNNAGTTNSADSVAPERNTAGAGKSLNAVKCVKAVAPDTGTVSKLPTAPPKSPAEIAVQCALSKQGAKYVWGAEGPNTFDCSGLVLWAYKQAGVSLPRTADQQIKSKLGMRISQSQLQPGDLIGTQLNTEGPGYGHIGIYTGNNTVVEAPESGDVVKTMSLPNFIHNQQPAYVHLKV